MRAFAFIWVIITISWFTYITIYLGNKEEKFKKLVGESCVINNDTLLIIDYSFFENDYTLSNGLKVNSELIKLNLVK